MAVSRHLMELVELEGIYKDFLAIVQLPFRHLGFPCDTLMVGCY